MEANKGSFADYAKDCQPLPCGGLFARNTDKGGTIGTIMVMMYTLRTTRTLERDWAMQRGQSLWMATNPCQECVYATTTTKKKDGK